MAVRSLFDWSRIALEYNAERINFDVFQTSTVMGKTSLILTRQFPQFVNVGCCAQLFFEIVFFFRLSVGHPPLKPCKTRALIRIQTRYSYNSARRWLGFFVVGASTAFTAFIVSEVGLSCSFARSLWTKDAPPTPSFMFGCI